MATAAAAAAAATASIAPFVDAAMIVHEKRSSTADRVAADVATRSSDVRVVSPSEYKEAARCLIDAFADDDCVWYSLRTPDNAHWSDQHRWNVYVSMFEYVVYASCLKGLVTTVGPDYACVALWNPPGKNIDDVFTVLRSGLWRLYFQFSRDGRARFFSEFLPLLTRSLDEVLGDRSGECWYLNYIGTKPEHRGHGYARKLIEHVTARADREGRPTYLESSHDINVVIYGKLGFKVMKPIFLQGDGGKKIKLDIMVREAVTESQKQKQEQKQLELH